MRAVVLALSFIVVALVSGALTAARAHDWYPPDCCSGSDCFPIDESALTPIPGGYVINASGLPVTGAKVRQSMDGRFHLCAKNGKPDGKPLCIFEPPRGF